MYFGSYAIHLFLWYVCFCTTHRYILHIYNRNSNTNYGTLLHSSMLTIAVGSQLLTWSLNGWLVWILEALLGLQVDSKIKKKKKMVRAKIWKLITFITFFSIYFHSSCPHYSSIGLLRLPFCKWKWPPLWGPHDTNLWRIPQTWDLCSTD